MAPLVPVFPVTSLPDRVNIVSKNFQEKRRKGPAVELEKCQLMEMVQYACNLSVTGQPVCTPVVRLFRRYSSFLAPFPSMGVYFPELRSRDQFADDTAFL